MLTRRRARAGAPAVSVTAQPGSPDPRIVSDAAAIGDSAGCANPLVSRPSAPKGVAGGVSLRIPSASSRPANALTHPPPDTSDHTRNGTLGLPLSSGFLDSPRPHVRSRVATSPPSTSPPNANFGNSEYSFCTGALLAVHLWTFHFFSCGLQRGIACELQDLQMPAHSEYLGTDWQLFPWRRRHRCLTRCGP